MRSLHKFFTFKAMRTKLVNPTAIVPILILAMALAASGQAKPAPKTLFYDSDGTGGAAKQLLLTNDNFAVMHITGLDIQIV